MNTGADLWFPEGAEPADGLLMQALTGACESLQLLCRIHPQAVLPDDLRELADDRLDQP